jgi:hypothetical protein
MRGHIFYESLARMILPINYSIWDSFVQSNREIQNIIRVDIDSTHSYLLLLVVYLRVMHRCILVHSNPDRHSFFLHPVPIWKYATSG